jgi:hypothetical protein
VRLAVGFITTSGLASLSSRLIGWRLAPALTVLARFVMRLILILATLRGPDGIGLHFQFFVPLDHNRHLQELHAIRLAINSTTVRRMVV